MAWPGPDPPEVLETLNITVFRRLWGWAGWNFVSIAMFVMFKT